VERVSKSISVSGKAPAVSPVSLAWGRAYLVGTLFPAGAITPWSSVKSGG
jgi:hypothetical protein